ncbi:PREDICTED: uncharacterized protein LOC108782744, partial [Cyphomyrmex costatus]|uniref:uncharacterized protein LOC108782744 n=1 Tax=Cyphomyrmex costatus TaxID=456900 RepID=UPI00085237CC
VEEYTVKGDKQRQTTILPEQISDCPDEEYEVLLLDEMFPETSRTSSGLLEKKIKIQPSVQDNMKLFYLSDDIENSWEREMKFSRTLRKIYEQDCILRRIQTNCENIDKKLDKLENDRLNIVTENVNNTLS